MYNKRVEYIDLFRGLAIILMVMGHIGFGDLFDRYIHAFHMPMWFFVSGYFFKDKGLGYIKYIKTRGKRLLIPYAFFGLLHYIIAVCFIDSSQGFLHTDYIKHYLLLNYDGLPISGVFWFLTCILIADIVFLFLRRTFKSEKCFFTAIVILSVFGMLYSKYSPFRMIWTADTAFVCLLFYFMGYAIRNYSKLNCFYNLFINKGILLTGFILAANCVLIVLTPHANLRKAEYPFSVLFYFNAMVAIMAYLALCNWAARLNIPGINQIKKWMCYIGENTIGYLCLNQLVILILRKIWPYTSSMGSIYALFRCFGILLISMLILTAITKIILRTPFKMLIGK